MRTFIRDSKTFGITENGNIFDEKGELKQHFNSTGYARTWLRGTSRPKWTFVHHIVAEVFIGPRPQGFVVSHKDDNRKNNHWQNLEYTTQGENIKHGMLLSGRTVPKGRDHACAKFSKNDLEALLSLRGNCSTRKAAALMNMSKTYVHSVWNGRINI